MKDETYLQHTPQIELLPGNRPLVGPIYQSVKFGFDDFEQSKSTDPNLFIYSRVSNPHRAATGMPVSAPTTSRRCYRGRVRGGRTECSAASLT